MESNIWKRLLGYLHSVEFWIAAIFLVLTNVFMFIQVLNRYWLRLPMVGLGDLTLYMFIMFMSVGAAVATWNETHVAVDAFRDQFLKGRPFGLKLHHVAMTVLAIIAMLFLLPHVASLMSSAIQYPAWATLVTWFNLSWLELIWGVCMFLVLFHLVEMATRHGIELRRMKNTDRREP